MRLSDLGWGGLKGGTLRGQANRRLLVIGLVAMLLIFTVGSVSYHFFKKRDLNQRKNQVTAYYTQVLPRMGSLHRTEGLQLASRIEFSRILEQTGNQRWPMLTAFLNAQWSFSEFSNLVVLDAAGKSIFHYGSESEALQLQASTEEDWLYAPQYRQFYRVYSVPLWLGKEGQGQLILFKTISHSSLSKLAIPLTHLRLIFDDRVVATSVDEAMPELDDPERYLRLEIPWAHPDAAGEKRHPVMLAYRDLSDLLPFGRFVARPILLSLMIVALLWYGLGRWLNTITLRVESLGQGARGYARQHDRSSLTPALAPALSRDDELKDTARAFEYLVDAIEEREREQRSYMETLELLEEAVIEFDAAGLIQRASPGWKRLLQQDVEVGASIYEQIDPDDLPLLEAQSALLFKGEKHSVTLRLRLRVRGKAKQNQELWIEARLLAFVGSDGRIDNIRGVLRDITQTYVHEQQITHMALHDALTELPNRVLLEDRFKIALRLAARNQEMVGVCFIDLDHFKMVNDTLGHKAGDRLLLSFSERLREQLREGDTLARWGGDEFVLLLPEMRDEVDIRSVAGKVIGALQQPLEIDGNEIRMTFSMGAAIYPNDAEDVETLFSQADRAMFFAKAQGRNQFCFFQDMASKGLGKKDLYIQNRLAAAIEQGLIQAWFQPVVDSQTRCCTSLEVLARWHDADNGWISPATFIPMAETLGLIGALGKHILLNSLDALTHINAQGYDILMAVNISKRQLFIPSFVEWLLTEVERRNLKPSQLILEITESVALNDVERGADIVQQLGNAGFHVAIDDFGTGYSSLSQLHEMHAGELKIDISFVRRLSEPDGKSMVKAIINMARALEMKTVAEGVEDEPCAQLLAEMGADCLQGYLFGKPMPLAEFEQWLEQNSQLQCQTSAVG